MEATHRIPLRSPTVPRAVPRCHVTYPIGRDSPELKLWSWETRHSAGSLQRRSGHERGQRERRPDNARPPRRTSRSRRPRDRPPAPEQCRDSPGPKRASKVETDITEEVVREIALPTGLVDNKVCAIDATWSGLRLVIRLANR